MKVKIIGEYQHMRFNVGNVGEVCGWVRCADDRAYCVVCVGKIFDFVDPFSIEKVEETI